MQNIKKRVGFITLRMTFYVCLVVLFAASMSFGKKDKIQIPIEDAPWSIEYVESVYDSGEDTTTFYYEVTVTDDPALSHFVLDLPYDCFVSADPSEGIEILGDKPDPTTGVTGIKWDRGQEIGTETYSFALAGEWSELGALTYSVKGAQIYAVSEIMGPVMNEDGICGSLPAEPQIPTCGGDVEPSPCQTSAIQGWEVKYYAGTWDYIPDFDTLDSYLKDNLAEVNILPTKSEILTSGLEDNLGVQFNGYIDINQYGKYSFYLLAFNNSKLYVDGALIVDNDSPGYWYSPTIYTGSCYLSPGPHKIRVEYIAKPATATYDGLDVKWSGPGFANTSIDVDKVWISDISCDDLDATLQDNDRDGVLNQSEEISCLTDPEQADTDCDGLSDGEEIFIYHTDPNDIDTDDDGVTDREEIEETLTNPTVFDSGITDMTDILFVNGADSIATSGTWETSDTELYLTSSRGYVDYNINVDESNVYQLKIAGNDNFETDDFALNLKIYVDGKYVAESTLKKESAIDDFAYAYTYTPWMEEGEHQVRILFEPECEECEVECETGDLDCSEVTYGKSLRIKEVILQANSATATNPGIVEEYTSDSGAIACLSGKTREFYIPTLPGITNIADNVSFFEHVFKTSGGISKYYAVVYDNQPHYLVSRDEITGEVLSVKTLQGMNVTTNYCSPNPVIYATDENVETFADGTVTVDMTIASSPLLEDVVLKVLINLAGVTFEDGTTIKELTAADFNESGEVVVKFVKTPAATKTSICHDMKVYQNVDSGEEFVGWVYF